MIQTFGIYAVQDLKKKCIDLINEGKSFTIKVFKDVNDQVHHWELDY